MKKLENFIVRNIAGEYIMMPVGKTALKFNGLIQANEVSAFIWQHIEEVNDLNELTNMICQEFDVDYARAYHDLNHIIEQLIQAKWIEK